MAAYVPSADVNTQWRDTVANIFAWIQKDFDLTPQRCTPSIALDANSQLQVLEDGYGGEMQKVLGGEHTGYSMYHHDMLAINTCYAEARPTYCTVTGVGRQGCWLLDKQGKKLLAQALQR